MFKLMVLLFLTILMKFMYLAKQLDSLLQICSSSCSVRFRKIPSLYAPALWNIHDMIVLSGYCRKKHCERWNNALDIYFSVLRLITHPREDGSMICKDPKGKQRLAPTKRIRRTTKDFQKNLLFFCQARRNGEKSV